MIARPATAGASVNIWRGEGSGILQDFFTDAALIAAYEKHIDAVLNHVNTLTGVRYKDDPTILAWENCNMCGLIAAADWRRTWRASGQISDWVETIGQHIKQQDSRHLYLDTSGIFRAYPKVLDNKTPDLVTFEYYPHWDALLGRVSTRRPRVLRAMPRQ